MRNGLWHGGEISADDRARLLGQRPATVWLTGLSAAGKSTLAVALERELFARGRLVCVLDGDKLRDGLSRDLGFSPADRCENIRRVAELARIMNDAGLIVITAFISPYRSDRRRARAIIGDDRFVEVFLDAPLAVCEARDPKGLYRRARAGQLADFTGVGAPYETPEAPSLRIETGRLNAGDSVRIVVDHLAARGILRGPALPEVDALGDEITDITHFRGLRIVNVFGRLNSERATELAAFWLTRGAISDPVEARRRTGEAVLLVLADDRIVGVNTVFRARLPERGEYWFYRRFMDPDYRIFGVGERMFKATERFLAERQAGEGSPRGIAVVAENPKLARKGSQRMLARWGMSFCGKTPQGLDLWRLDFPAG